MSTQPRGRVGRQLASTPAELRPSAGAAGAASAARASPLVRAALWTLAALCAYVAVAVAWNLWSYGGGHGAAAAPHPALTYFDPTVRGVGVRAEESAGAAATMAPAADHLFVEADGAASHAAAMQYAFGRWRRPVRDIAFLEDDAPSLAARVTRLTTLKRWAYFALDDERFFVAVALVQFNYVADVFLYVVDKTANATEKWEYTARRPLGWGIQFAPSSVQGCSTWAASPFHPDAHDISICYDPVDLLYKVDIAVNVTSTQGETRPLMVTMRAALDDALVLLFPLDNTGLRPAYVHKSAGMHTVGALHWDTVSPADSTHTSHDEHFLSGLSSLDWTKALARRETRWRWASFNGYARVTIARITMVEQDGKRVEQATEVVVGEARTAIGINLSTDVYDYKGHSQENAIWINGTMFPLLGVKFAVPAAPLRSPWTVSSIVPAGQEVVRLHFRPTGAREDHTHVVGLIISDFVQPFGYMNGTIEFRPQGTGLLYRVNMDHLFGVMEDHLAVW